MSLASIKLSSLWELLAFRIISTDPRMDMALIWSWPDPFQGASGRYLKALFGSTGSLSVSPETA